MEMRTDPYPPRFWPRFSLRLPLRTIRKSFVC